MSLVNSLYPVEYFQLADVDQIEHPNDSWWSSKERHASVHPSRSAQYMRPEVGGVITSEIQEVDLGRIRQINCLTMDVGRAPFTISIEYDALSLEGGDRQWTPVRRINGMPFDDFIRFEANARHMWRTTQFYFTDERGEIVHTRRLRIKYERRDERWPTKQSAPFPYPIFVKNLRTMRIVLDERDVVGPLFGTSTEGMTLHTIDPSGSQEVRQQFAYPSDAIRGSITPKLMGFSILVDVVPTAHGDIHTDVIVDDAISHERVSYSWSIVNPISGEALDSGVVTGTAHDGAAWLHIASKLIDGSLDDVYELRATCLTPEIVNGVWVGPSSAPTLTMKATFTASSRSVECDVSKLAVGDRIKAGDTTYRITAVGDTSVTIDDAHPTSETVDVERLSPMLAPPRWTTEVLPTGFTFTNGSATVAYSGDVPLRFTSPGFSAGSAYEVDDVVYEDGEAFIVTVGGTAGTTPTWNPEGETTTTGDVTFLNLGDGPTYNLLAPGDRISLLSSGRHPLEVAAVTATDVTLTATYDGSSGAETVYRVSYTDDAPPSTMARFNSKSLVAQVWADVADSGRDVLGNDYRYGTHYDDVERLFDDEKTGWMSAPQPSPHAVESLFFDVRGERGLTVVDVIKIAPRTPGIRMHVYYNREGVKGRAPESRDEWDQMIWTPVNEVYTLRKENAIELPSPIKAAFIKLEFTGLRPLPFKIPQFPEIAPAEYRRHPTWIEEQFANTSVRDSVEDWFVDNATAVQWQMLKTLREPVLEFQYKHREFMAAVAAGASSPRAINSGIIDTSSNTFVDPVTASRIKLGFERRFGGSLMTTINGGDLLARAVINKYDPTNARLSDERAFKNQRRRTPDVSSIGGRAAASFSELANTPMWFNRRCRHIYRIEKGRFNRKAYYAGIKSVEFSRNDYTVQFDDALVEDNLHDDAMLEVNTFEPETQTRIPDAEDLVAADLVPVSAYASYEVDGVQYTDEPITLFNFEQTRLANDGHAVNIRLFSERGGLGLAYELERDFLTSHGRAGADTFTTISRSDLNERLVVPADDYQSKSSRDAAIVTAVYTQQAVEDGVDAATVWAFAQISAVHPVEYTDSGTVEATGEIEGHDTLSDVDSSTVEATAEASGTSTSSTADSGTVEATSEAEATEEFSYIDEATVELEGRPIIDTYGGVEGESEYGGGSYGDLFGSDLHEES